MAGADGAPVSEMDAGEGREEGAGLAQCLAEVLIEEHRRTAIAVMLGAYDSDSIAAASEELVALADRVAPMVTNGDVAVAISKHLGRESDFFELEERGRLWAEISQSHAVLVQEVIGALAPHQAETPEDRDLAQKIFDAEALRLRKRITDDPSLQRQAPNVQRVILKSA